VVRLTALVCVHNQEAQLSQCLRRLSFCDEIIVVADRCTDRSAEVARRQGATVVSGIFPLESQRKAAGLAAATGDWILELQPDEQVCSALAWEVRATLTMRPVGDWFEIPVHNYIGDDLVLHGWAGGLAVGRAPRLYRPWAKRWKASRVGEAVMCGAPGGPLKGALRRDLAADSAELMSRLNALAALKAEDLADNRRAGGLAGALARGAYGFVAAYIGCNAWREGRLGFLAALTRGLYPVLAHLRAREVLDARERAMATGDGRGPEVVGFGAR
jgi:glycosyltransferase involved in cell wall biosynthesis